MSVQLHVAPLEQIYHAELDVADLALSVLLRPVNNPGNFLRDLAGDGIHGSFKVRDITLLRRVLAV